MTPPNAAECEPAAMKCAVTFQRLDCVGGTAGIITARSGQQGAERYLIRTHEQNEKRSHQVSLCSASAGLPEGCGLFRCCSPPGFQLREYPIGLYSER